MKAAPLGLRLFLEGVEVPVISAQVEIQPNQAAAASIQVIPTDSILNLMPRTLVHLFFLEETIGPGDLASLPEDNADLNRIDVVDSKYKLLFCGEVVGVSYSKTPTQRQAVLQCLDLSLYWDTCYQWYADWGKEALTDHQHHFVGAGEGLFDSVADGTTWVISTLMGHKPKSPQYQNTGGLLGGLIHVMEAVGGVKPRGTFNAPEFPGYSGVNDFFTIAELRYNLLGQLGAVASDTTSSKLYSGRAFIDWLKNGMGSLGSLISFRDIMRQIGQWIFHDLYPNPAAYYTPSKLQLNKKVPISWRNAAVGSQLEVEFKQLQRFLTTAMTNFGEFLNNMNDIAPLVMAAQSTYEAQDLVRAMDPQVQAMRPDNSDDLFKLTAAFSEIRSSVNMAARDSEAFRVFADYTNEIVELPTAAGAALSDPSDYETRAKSSKESCIQAIDQIEGLLGIRGRVNQGTREVIVEEGGHLFSQLILPETFFVPPPRCNVIFPDQYFQFTYSRNFLREVTRLSCHGGMGFLGGNSDSTLLGYWYFAPTIKDIGGKSLFDTMSRGTSVILPHEIHSGIVPKFSWLTQAHRWASKSEAKGQSSDPMAQGDSSPMAKKVGYVQRVANFQFYQARWEARSMSITGKFNPYVVLGLPAVLINRGMPAPAAKAAIENVLGKDFKPMQFVGKVASISHSITQQGGQTAIVFTHCRTHKGLDDEFLGVMRMKEKRPLRFQIVIRPQKLAIKLKAGKKMDEDTLNILTLLNLYMSGVVTGGYMFKAYGQVIAMPAETGDRVILTSDEARVLRYKGPLLVPQEVRIPFESVLTSNAQSLISFEEAVRPGWYDDVWRNENISQSVYLPLLGTRAITDDATLVTAAVSNPDQVDQQQKIVDTASDTVIVFDENGSKSTTMGPPLQKNTENAIDGISIIYGRIAEAGLDVHDFISSFTKRPIASMTDILGSSDLTFTPAGDVTSPTTMKEGFHSRAFGGYNKGRTLNNKYELIADGDAGDLLIGAKTKELGMEQVIRKAKVNPKINPVVDPRGAAQARVLAYSAELKISRGLQG